MCVRSPDVPGRTHRKDAFIAASEQHPFQKPRALIVEKVFIPSVLNKLGDHHKDAAVGMVLRHLENELNDGNDDEPVGRRQEMELRWLLAFGAEGLLNIQLPFRLKQFRVLGWLDV